MLGPIFSIEMVTSSRRSRQFIVRALYAAALLLCLWFAYETTTAFRGLQNVNLAQSANVASTFFQQFAWLQLLAVVMVGPALASGTVAVERERRTIEYLFATDLTNREIVIGKLAAQLIQLGYVVLAGLPVLALAMLMGGIAPEQLLAVFAITLSTLVCVVVLAVTISVWSPRVRDAITRVYLVLFAALVVPGLIVMPILSFAGMYHWVQPINDYLVYLNPFSAVAKATWSGMFRNRGVNVNWQPVWELVTTQTVITLTLTALSVWAVRRVHLREAGKAPPKARRILSRKRRAIGENPMIWKELTAARTAGKLGIAGRIAMWLVVLPVVGFSVYWFLEADGSASAGFTLFAVDLLSCGALLLVAARAATSITSEREKDTWITLLSTPLSSAQIIGGKLAGSLYTARWLLLVLGILWTLQALKMPVFVASIPFTLATLVCVGFFYTGMGLKYSLRSRNSTRAMGVTLATALFAGGGYLFCCLPVMIGTSSNEILFAAPCVPFLLACPSILIVDGPGTRPADLITTYGLGTVGYLIAGAFMFTAMVNGFDRANGRIPDRQLNLRRR